MEGMTRRPVPTRRELGLEAADRAGGRHWAWGLCWCGKLHAGEEAPGCLVAPPWDATRDGEPSFPAVAR